jgi:hypothetical protein
MFSTPCSEEQLEFNIDDLLSLQIAKYQALAADRG